jgi:hypothetical protein
MSFGYAAKDEGEFAVGICGRKGFFHGNIRQVVILTTMVWRSVSGAISREKFQTHAHGIAARRLNCLSPCQLPELLHPRRASTVKL